MKRLLDTGYAIVIALALATVVPATTWAFSISLTPYNNVVRWDTANLTYYLDPNGAPDISGTADIDAMHAAFADWQAVSCSALTFQYLGTTSNKSILPITGKTNGKNELVFINNSSWKFGQYTLGVTSPLYYYDGKIFEADIAFNGYLQSWTTTYNPWKVDVKAVTIHEIGHYFGQQHVLKGYDAYDPPTMAPQTGPGSTSASLEEDDKLGACFLYPKGGYYTCSNNDDCPYVVDNYSNGDEYYSKKVNCDSEGYCTGLAGVSPGSVDVGGTCAISSDCKSGYSCESMDSGLKMCTKVCDPYADNCPDGFHCQKVYTTNKNVCIAGSKKKKDGDACSSSYECETSFCFPTPDGSGMFCRVACTSTGSACPDGKKCWTSSYGSTGGCFPPDQVPTIKMPLGSDCAGDYECTSDICFGDPGTQSLCRQSCDLGAPNCYAGYYCANIGGDRGACLPGEPQPSLKDDGAACGSNEECLSNWCVNLVGTNQGYCRRACNLDDWACPWGTSCISYGSADFGVCMPSVNKSGTGDICTNGNKCVTGICWTDPEGQSYCTQNCISGWCPNNMDCVDADYFGTLCALPQGTPPQEVTPPIPDTGSGGQDNGSGWPPTDSGTPQGDTTTTPNPPGGGSTCSAGLDAGANPLALGLLALLWIPVVRRRFGL